MDYLIPAALIALLAFKVYTLYGNKRQVSQEETDITLAAIAHFLFDDSGADRSTPFKENLDTSKLDYSLKSLEYFDDFLDKIRGKAVKLSRDDYLSIVLRCGAYVGEVIKRNAKAELHWTTYDEAVKKMPSLKDFGLSLSGFYLLWNASNGALTFPMGKIEKFSDNGREDSVYMFAKVMTQGTPQEAKNTQEYSVTQIKLDEPKSESEPEEQSVLIHLDGTGLPDEIYKQYDLMTLEDKLTSIIEEQGLGEYDGNAFGQGETILYLYGPDAEKIYAAIEKTIKDYPLCKGAKVVIRKGGPDATAREVRIS